MNKKKINSTNKSDIITDLDKEALGNVLGQFANLLQSDNDSCEPLEISVKYGKAQAELKLNPEAAAAAAKILKKSFERKNANN